MERQMEYCDACFGFVEAAGGQCPRCGTLVPPTREPEEGGWRRGRIERFQAAPPSRLERAFRWTRGLLIGSLLVVVGGAGLMALADQNRAAQASWFVQAQLGEKRLVRQVELQQALAALQVLHGDLKVERERAGITADERSAWERRFQERLQQVQLSFRLDGQVTFNRTNARVEVALRNATLYLASLGKKVAAGDPQQTYAMLEQSLMQSLQDATTNLG